MKKYILISLVLIVALISGCSKDEYSLDKSIFKEDSVYPGLPEYSEWGYNTFGAYIDREAFVSSNSYLPLKIIVNSDTLNMVFTGDINREKSILKISFIGYPITDYLNLMTLHNKTFDLTSDSTIVTLTRNNETKVLDVFAGGKLTVKRAQKLFIDNEVSKIILSGEFDFKTLYNNEPISITKGRYDVGIGNDSFYNF